VDRYFIIFLNSLPILILFRSFTSVINGNMTTWPIHPNSVFKCFCVIVWREHTLLL